MVTLISVPPVRPSLYGMFLSMIEVKLHKRCDQNRKRSKRRSIYCPIDGCYLHSVSQKYSLFANVDLLKQKKVSRKNTNLAPESTVNLKGEWLEAFWCDRCQKTQWYHVQKLNDSTYKVSVATAQIWQQAVGVAHTEGNPSVSEFTRKNASGSPNAVKTYY